MSIEAIKKALEALEQMQSALTRCMGSHKAEEGDRHRALAQGRTAITALRTAIEQAEKRWSEFNETTKRNIEHADWYLSTHPAPEPVGVVKVLPLGDGHKPMHWADWTDADNPPPENTPLYTTPPPAPVQEPVAAQCRFPAVAWAQCDVEHARMVMANPHEWKGYEVRLLYTTPPAAPVQGCDFCNHPLYAGTKCKNCGREAAAPVQEPVIQRVMARLADLLDEDQFKEIEGMVVGAGYTPPAAQRQWVGLTPREIYNLWEDSGVPFVDWDSFASIAQAIQAKLKEKNT